MPLGAGYAPGDMPEWMAAFNMQLMAAEQAMDIAEAEIEADLQDLENHMQGIEHDVGGGDSGTLLWAENAVQPTQSDSDEESLHDEQFAAAIMSDEPGMAFGLTSNFAKVLFLRRLMEKGDGNLQWSVQQLASLCQMHDKSCEREFKDELRRQGVIERMVVTLAEAERHVERYQPSRSLRKCLFNALARSLYDHRKNAVLATELGLLSTTAQALRRSEERSDELMSEYQLCCVNNACGMILTVKNQYVLSSGIIPVLIRYASGAAPTTNTGKQIAIAALANLSNTADLCQSLIQEGAVEVLAAGLRSISDEVAHPTVAYMQSLSAVIKTVGRGSLMGGMGSRFAHIHRCIDVGGGSQEVEVRQVRASMGLVGGSDNDDTRAYDHASAYGPQRAHARANGYGSFGFGHPDANEGDEVVGEEKDAGDVFWVNGSQSSCRFDQSRMHGLVVDRRSTRWMLEYLSASCYGEAYPNESNIFGTAWKVVQSVACMAQGSARNRVLLHQEGVWPLLVRTLLRDYDSEGRLFEEEERQETEAHVIYAMRKMLRSHDDMAACAEALANLSEPVSYYQLKVKAIATGCTRWRPPPLVQDIEMPSGMLVEFEGKSPVGHCCIHSEPVREVAAELLLTWGYAWEVERLLWLAVKKPVPADHGGGRLGLLTPSMVRCVMKFVVMQGGGDMKGQEVAVEGMSSQRASVGGQILQLLAGPLYQIAGVVDSRGHEDPVESASVESESDSQIDLVVAV